MPSKAAKTPTAKLAAAKPTAKTAARGKTAAPQTKTAPKSKTTAKSKSIATKPLTKKPAPKKLVAKKPVAKKTRPKKAVPQKHTVATLSKAMSALDTRLKGSDTRNRTALKALEQLVASVETNTKKSTTTQKASITRRLNTLEKRLTAYADKASEQARSSVREELAAVAAPGADRETLEHALASAHARLDAHEAHQCETLVRLNRHIADLATAVDAQLRQETQARLAASAALDTKIDSVKTKLASRMDQIEDDTAAALETVGEKVAEFAAVLDNRSRQSDAETAERLADLAQETQSDFTHARTDMTTRLEALETIAANWSPTPYNPAANSDDPRVDQMGDMIAGLQDELARLHARVATVQSAAPAQTAPTGFGNVVPLAQSTPQAIQPTPLAQPPAQYASDNPYAEAARALEASPPPLAAPQTYPEQSYADDTAQDAYVEPVAAPKPARESHIPEEFDPSAFTPAPVRTSVPEPMTPNAPATPTSFTAPPPPPFTSTPPQTPPMASTGGMSAPDVEPLMPAPLPVATYADPAYAEQTEMRAERIAGDSAKRGPSLPNLPISGKNLRLAGLVAGVAVVGIFAAKTVLGGNTAPAPQRADANVQAINPVNSVDSQSGFNVVSDVSPAGAQTIPPTAPIGTYAETQTPQIAPAQQNTLEAAVAAGNPIAQFQLGLSKLQAGDANEAARLIRLAANRNQPAAQYRLAKLYETGTGVAKDDVTARELVERAALGGNRIAMHDLGNYYAYGQGGLERDMGEALNWFEKAAERGVVDSQFNVAFLREGNEGVLPDPEAALFWYTIAAAQGDQGAPERISVLAAQVSDVARADVKARAARFAPKSVDEAANGIFRNVPWGNTGADDRQASAARAAKITKVREAQTLLSELGYEIGGADGAAGPKTRSAIRNFEAVNGLPETGEVTDALLQRLEIAVGA